MDAKDAVDDEVDLREYLTVLWRHKYLVLGVMAIGVVAAGPYAVLTPPTYEAQALLLVGRPPLQVVVLSDPTDPRLRILALLAEPRSPPSSAIAELARLPMLQQELSKEVLGPSSRQKLSVELRVEGGTGDFVKFIARDRDPKQAAEIANRWARLVVNEAGAVILGIRSGNVPQVKLISAAVPSAPVGPRLVFTLTGAIIGSFMVGAMLAFVTDYFRPGAPVPDRVS